MRIHTDVGMAAFSPMFPVGKNMYADITPKAKGNANPAKSLSSVISLLIFANVGIIFVTLRGYD